MRSAIISYVKTVCQRWTLECIYIRDRDVFLITKGGRAVDAFTSDQFYQIPKSRRLTETLMKLKVGLVHNMGEKTMKDQVYHKRNIGTVIYGK